MPYGAFNRRDRHITRLPPFTQLQQARYRRSLSGIAPGGRRGVCVDVIHVRVRETGIHQRLLHGAKASAALLVARGDVTRIARRSIAPAI